MCVIRRAGLTGDLCGFTSDVRNLRSSCLSIPGSSIRPRGTTRQQTTPSDREKWACKLSSCVYPLPLLPPLLRSTLLAMSAYTTSASSSKSAMPAPSKPRQTPFASTANSSTTTLHETAAQNADLPPELREELARDEARFERYGGDDPVDPPPKTPRAPAAAPSSVPQPVSTPPSNSLEKSKDPNLVDWDGPNDPENPQNWSRSRKWMVTWTCVLLSINA
jgi:hypothetical protein